MTSDQELLLQFARQGSEAAFAELVQRHLNFVYAAALRQLNGDRHLAQDAAQLVFTDLAHKARRLVGHPSLAGWLFTSTRFAVAKIARTEQRRRAREQRAHMLQEPSGEPLATEEWNEIRPFIDDALADLPAPDRTAILLRYLEGQDYATIAARLALTADAVRLRVDRALERVRKNLARRGVVSTAAALTLGFAKETAIAAPAGAAVSISTAAVAGAAAGTTAFYAIMSIGKIAVGAGIAAAAVGGFWWQHTTATALAAETEVTQLQAREIAGLQAKTTALRTALRQAEEQAAATQSELAASHEETALARNRAPDPRPTPGGTARRTTATAAPDAATTPATREADLTARRVAQDRRIVLRMYGPTMDAMNLPPDQREQLTRLLIDLREAATDYVAAAASTGVDPLQDRETSQLSISDARNTIQDQIRQLIGDDKYAQFMAADGDIRRTATLDRLQKNLSREGTPLTREQGDQLIATMRELNTERVNQAVVDRAGDFLNPTQLSSLDTIRSERERGLAKPRYQKAVEANLPAAKTH